MSVKFWLIASAIFSAQQVILADEGSFSAATNALFRCGIRKRFGSQLIHHGRTAELGQWPWHVAMYHGEKYACGGSLIDQRHVLTAAHCVVRGKNRPNKSKNKNITIEVERIRIHLGQHSLDDLPEQVQVKNVSEIVVHPEFSTNRNDIALVVLSSVVQFSELVIPICLVGSRVAQGEDLIERRGWVAGWGITETGNLSTELKTTQMPVVNNTVCVQDDPELFGKFVAPTMFCASDRNGTSVCQGDSGGGMYLLAGDRWELRGITSFAGAKDSKECDTQRFVVFSKVSSYFEWIKGLTGEAVKKEDIVPKRIKCQEYSKIARKRNNGVCLNARSPHTVAIIDRNQRHISSGTIISEKFVLTRAPSLYDMYELRVDWDELRVRVGNQPDRRVLQEITNPNYDSRTLRHHVMLLELEAPLVFSSGLLPACLANEATENLYDTLLLNGYTGASVEDGRIVAPNDFFESVDSKVMSNGKCNRTIQSPFRAYKEIHPEDLCTNFETESSFTWAGIVGGPLQTVNTRSCMFTQVGVTQLIYPPLDSVLQYTIVYSRVTAYLDWIEGVVWSNETRPEDTADSAPGEAPTQEEEEEEVEEGVGQTTTARPLSLGDFRPIPTGWE
ncbi:hypothetical protein pipiens_012620 [Culex pipiens pipiens]|uniref:Peptidase S1 domain-containing protein n=1 Tax=Culex pipiens pipiens TaxID=38569 RepID=A0ABD1D1R7_CULPP